MTEHDDLTPADVADTDIAVVGMAGRFPGAPDVEALWQRVRDGDDCLVDLSRQDLLARGVPADVVDDPDYVRRNGFLADVEMFDPGFFGIGPRDAAIMDPQHRHFLECSWEALESSGHVPERFAGAIGVFGGCGMNTYMLNNLLTNPRLVEQVGMFLLRHTANDKDFFTTTLSYKLDLRGPSINVQTACSTSLVAVHLAAQSLLAFECDLALAGGSTIEVPSGVGYMYHEGEILAPDGVCRAFDARSAGTVLTAGVGVVVLRRLADALDDRDPILAVIKGSAVNNDGQRKVGYLAPSVDGHADVVREALAVADLSARDIQLLEAHGTGTAVGDPIEVAALTEAFRSSTPDVGYCRLVSTKPNIGHLDTAAGVASLIKVVQALRHRTLPPLANHTGTSQLLDIERTPFTIGTDTPSWPGDRPRRAGVSSLGVGGTNAHAILQEAPALAPSPPAVPEQVLVLSARDGGALNDAASRLADFLEVHRDSNLADVAHTLVEGRRAMAHRRVIVATDVENAIDVLRSSDRNRAATLVAPDDAPGVAFLFPGGGAQYNGMAAGLDDRFDVFHQVLRDGIARVEARSGVDLAQLLRPDAAPDALLSPTASLPATFLTSIALARQWMAWGVRPTTFVGHSLGEYAAAHLAGVLTLDGALDLVVARAALMERASGVGAAMLAVPLPVTDVEQIVPPSLSIATINADDECVVAGRIEDIEAFAEAITTPDLSPTMIPLAAAAHSALLDPILSEFLQVVRRVELATPQVPYLSNLTGTWIEAHQATDPQYWVDHLRHTVRFADDLRTLLASGPFVLMELGPGHSLSSYARRQEVKPVAAIPALRHQNQLIDDTAATLLAFARGWTAGVDVDLDRFSGPERRRLRLPTYAFRKERHWIEPGGAAISTGAAVVSSVAVEGSEVRPTREPVRIADLAEEFWAPAWVERDAVAPSVAPVGPWVVVGDAADPFVAALARDLTARGTVVSVTPSPHPAQLTAARSVVLAGSTTDVDAALDRWLTTASAAARALGDVEGAPTLLAAVTRGATDAAGRARHPQDAMALGIVGTAPREYQELRTVLIDLDPNGTPADDAAAAVGELFGSSDQVVARRGLRRLTPVTERTTLGPASGGAPTFRRGGNYLVTGGLGGVGFALARHLVRDHEANVVVVASRPVPEGIERAEWLARHGYDEPTSRRIRRLAELESFGPKVMVVAGNLADPVAVSAVVDGAEHLIGRLDGAIHAAGELRDRPIELATHEEHEAVIGAKARGALALADVLAERGAELLLLVSSTSTILLPEGQAAYVAANAVLDSLAGTGGRDGRLRVVTINYGLWSELGIAAAAARRGRLGLEPGEPVDHPVLSELATERDGTIRLTGTLAIDQHWVVDEHRTGTGVAVLPGTGHIELFLAAAELAGLGAPRLSAVGLLEPLVVADDQPVVVRVSISGDGDRRAAYIESDGGVGVWRLHSEADVIQDDSPPPKVDVPVLPAEAVSADPLARTRAHLTFGPRWQTEAVAWWPGVDAVNGEVTIPAPYDLELDAWVAHPALVDTATGFGIMLGDRDDALYVPVGYESVKRWRSLAPTSWVRATRQDTSTGDLTRVDLMLGDGDGPTLAIEGLTLRPVESGALAALDVAGTTVAPEVGHRVSPIVALAERHGIRADEGGDLTDRVLASGRSRMIASSIDLEDLILVVSPPEPAAAPGPSQPATAGAVTVTDTIRSIWIDLLGVADVGDDDDFFEIGGHSLIAIRLMSRIHKELGVRFQLASIFEAPTIASLTALARATRPDLDTELAAAAAATSTSVAPIAATSADGAPTPTVTTSGAAPARQHQALITISPAGAKEPLFIVHGAGGNVLFLWSLARAMAGSRPIYGFQAHGVDGADMPDPSVEEMARRYVTELRAKHEGPYLLGGYSGGGIVTIEMVRQLHALGEEVRYIVLFDSAPPGRAVLPPLRVVRNFVGNMRRHGLDPLKPYVRQKMRESMARFVPARPERTAQIDVEERDLGMRDIEDLGFVNLFYYFSAAADRYEMPRIHVDAAILKADWVWPGQPDDYYWSEFIDGEIDIAEVPGDHHAMFYPENAPRLAEVLSEILDRRHL